MVKYACMLVMPSKFPSTKTQKGLNDLEIVFPRSIEEKMKFPANVDEFVQGGTTYLVMEEPGGLPSLGSHRVEHE